jgi:hypothetical protein
MHELLDDNLQIVGMFRIFKHLLSIKQIFLLLLKSSQRIEFYNRHLYMYSI